LPLTSPEGEPARLHYSLAPRVVVRRARALALAGGMIAVAPAWLVLALAVQLGIASRTAAYAVTAVVGLLGVTRAIVTFARARRRLAALHIDADAEGLTVTGERGPLRVQGHAITRALEVEGRYGGLRLEIAAGPQSVPSRIDVPRGGESFGELRARIAAWSPLARPPRRPAWARALLAVAVVLALFFVPFAVADARGTRVAAAILLLVTWGLIRAARGRS